MAVQQHVPEWGPRLYRRRWKDARRHHRVTGGQDEGGEAHAGAGQQGWGHGDLRLLFLSVERGHLTRRTGAKQGTVARRNCAGRWWPRQLFLTAAHRAPAMPGAGVTFA
ncbi:hypothetical protein A7D27_18395 [Pseudomonas sp. 1D4]|nr:hypothetical protein A7D27_18395 [Pseudomonas sp. 1D4]